MWGDVLAAWGPKAPSLSVCYPSVIVLLVVFMVAESQKVTWGWGGMMETYFVIWAPFTNRFGGVSISDFLSKKASACEIIGFWVLFTCHSGWNQAHRLGDSCVLSVPPTCLSGKSLRLRSGGDLLFLHLPGCSPKKMVKPDGASHCREVVSAWEMTHFRVSVCPSSTVTVSVWLVRKASAEEENWGQSRWHGPHHSRAEAGV